MSTRDKDMRNKNVNAVVDRLEGAYLILLWQEDESVQFHVPARLFPELSEGDIIEIEMRKYEAGTGTARKNVDELKRRLREKSFDKR